MNFLLRFLITSVIGYFLLRYIPGGQYRDQPGTMLAAVVIALIDSFINPKMVTSRIPITIYTLMVLMTGINVVMIKVCDRYIPGFDISGWLYPAVAGVAMAALSLLINRFVKAD